MASVSSPLWDNNKFTLHDHWPRQSIANQQFPFSRQPFRLFYQLYFIVTFPLRVLFVLIPQVLYQQLLDKNAPPNYRWIDSLAILIARTLIDKLWLPTGTGERGRHFTAPLKKATQLKMLKSTKALPEIIHPTLQMNQLKDPVRLWAQEAGVEKADDLTIWWLGHRSQQSEQTKAKKGEKIMLYLSGGGYLIGTCYPGHDFGSIPGALLKETQRQCRTNPSLIDSLPQSFVSVEYRRTEHTSTPGALIDALSIYYHLVDNLGFKPSNISLSGDSAGGHLVNTLVRYLVEDGKEVPGKIILISPWGDQAGTTIEHGHSSYKTMLPYDILSDNFYHYCKDVFARNLDNPNQDALLDVYFSPTAALGMVKTREITQSSKGGKSKQKQVIITKSNEKDIFANWPDTLLTVGKYEVLKDQSIEMWRRLKLSKEAEGKNQEKNLSFFMTNTCHDPYVAPFFVFTKERREAEEKMISWLAL